MTKKSLARLITWFSIVALAGVTHAQVPSVRSRMGLNGSVRTIRQEFQQYRWESSKWETSGDPRYDLIHYDRYGRCLTSDLDPGSGWRPFGLPLPPATAAKAGRYELVRKPRNGMGWKTVWQFDDQGRLGRFEAYALYEHGPSLSSWQQFTYDSEGRVAELTYWANWGWSPHQTEPYPPIRLTYWFDSDGRIGGWARADNPKDRSTLTYDTKGRVVKQVDESADGDVVTRVTTQTWDGYDQHGNWTVRTITEASRDEDGDEPNHKDVIRRSIRYRKV